MSVGQWQRMKLADVLLEIKNGITYQNNPSSGGLPISRIQTISDGSVNAALVGFAGFERDEVDAYLLEDGDILFSHINSFSHVGKVAIVEEEHLPMVHGMNLLRLRADSGTILSRFLFWSLRTHQFLTQVRSLTRNAVNQASINIRNLGSCEIEFPPLDEQRRIVAELEDHLQRLDATRIRLERAKSDLAHFLAAALDRYFVDSGHEEGKLGFMEAFEVLASPHPGYKQKEYLANGAVPIVDQSKHLVAGHTNQTDRVIRAAEPVLVFGDHTRIVKYVDFDFAVGADGTKLLRAKAEILDHKFGYRLLQAVRLRNRGYARHFSELKKQQFSVPSLTKQRQVIGLFDEIESRVNEVQKRIDDSKESLETAQTSILHRAFFPLERVPNG